MTVQPTRRNPGITFRSIMLDMTGWAAVSTDVAAQWMRPTISFRDQAGVIKQLLFCHQPMHCYYHANINSCGMVRFLNRLREKLPCMHLGYVGFDCAVGNGDIIQVCTMSMRHVAGGCEQDSSQLLKGHLAEQHASPSRREHKTSLFAFPWCIPILSEQYRQGRWHVLQEH